MDELCANCRHFHYEYSAGSNGIIMRYDDKGYCNRTTRQVRKKSDKTCTKFSVRKVESEKAHLYRKQQLLNEIAEWAEWLKKIKTLCEFVIQIQELFPLKGSQADKTKEHSFT